MKKGKSVTKVLLWRAGSRRRTVEDLGSGRLVVDVHTLDVVFHLANKEPLDSALGFGSLGTGEPASRKVSIRERLQNPTFILLSSLSWRTRLNSWTSCCINESSDFHPNDFVSSFVPDMGDESAGVRQKDS